MSARQLLDDGRVVLTLKSAWADGTRQLVFEPLELLDIVVHRHNWGEDRVYYRDGHGLLTSLPAGWTSVVPDDAFVAVAAGRSRFRVQDLVDLAALVLRLRP